ADERLPRRAQHSRGAPVRQQRTGHEAGDEPREPLPVRGRRQLRPVDVRPPRRPRQGLPSLSQRMASAAVVEAVALAARAPSLAASRAMPAQAGGSLVPRARHGDEGPAARTGGGRMTADALPLPQAPTVDEAYDFCRAIAHRYGANFSVGFRFLPRVKRRAVYAAYAFCRWADDIADEDGRAPDVAQQLDAWEAELHRCYAGNPSHPITVALADALQHFAIPISAFQALIDGCRQDIIKHRYATFDELLHYCELVA